MTVYAVLDFETTGMSPDYGASATEIAIVKVQNGRIIDRYQSLMNGNVYIPPFIQSLTGISNAMIRQAPPVREVMQTAFAFAAGCELVAHNAAFDRKFWEHALIKAGHWPHQDFICTMLLARRVFPDSPNHKLSTLVTHLDLPVTGQFHRALADAEATAHLFVRLQERVHLKLNQPADQSRLLQVQRQRIGTF